MTNSLLYMKNVTAFYGGSQALYGLSLQVNHGEVVALMGRNGAGKSTAIKTISRMIRHKDGEILFCGTDLDPLTSHRAARLGIGLVPEGRRCFATLSVEENLVAAARTGHWNLARVFRLFPQLRERRGKTARTLSGGEQQMLAIGRALMTNPRLLILDEATEGLAPLVRKEIWAAVLELRKGKDLTILLVDKSPRELAKVADRCVVLERGRDVWTGTFDELTPEIAVRHLGV